MKNYLEVNNSESNEDADALVLVMVMEWRKHEEECGSWKSFFFFFFSCLRATSLVSKFKEIIR